MREVVELVNEAVEKYVLMLHELKQELEAEFDGCYSLSSDLIDELVDESPYFRLEGDLGQTAYVRILPNGDIEAEACIEAVYNDHGEGRIEEYWETSDVDISPRLYRALQTARETAIALEAMASKIKEVV